MATAAAYHDNPIIIKICKCHQLLLLVCITRIISLCFFLLWCWCYIDHVEKYFVLFKLFVAQMTLPSGPWWFVDALITMLSWWFWRLILYLGIWWDFRRVFLPKVLIFLRRRSQDAIIYHNPFVEMEIWRISYLLFDTCGCWDSSPCLHNVEFSRLYYSRLSSLVGLGKVG